MRVHYQSILNILSRSLEVKTIEEEMRVNCQERRINESSLSVNPQLILPSWSFSSPSNTLELGLALSLVRLVNSGSPLRSFPSPFPVIEEERFNWTTSPVSKQRKWKDVSFAPLLFWSRCFAHSPNYSCLIAALLCILSPFLFLSLNCNHSFLIHSSDGTWLTALLIYSMISLDK